jgi:tetratricopeptide (TPR) repeat protein
MLFRISYDDFDVSVLPDSSLEKGTSEFESAVRTYFATQFADVGGVTDVTFGADAIQVEWFSSKRPADLEDQSEQLLSAGDLTGAVAVLKALTAVEPRNVPAHYNLGMALSDLGDLENAQLNLLRATTLDPGHASGLVALGVALYRAGNIDGAQRRLQEALKLEPDNAYAHRNLAAILASGDKPSSALEHMRRAVELLPQDQNSLYGLGLYLLDFGSPDDLKEADELLQRTIELNPTSQIGELAKGARSRIAQQTMRQASGGIRMDAVMYCLGALEKFQSMGNVEVQAVALEIAVLGQSGLQVNDPSVTYTLRSLPGEFTALHLMSLMYVAFQQIAPDHDIGFDLSSEYQVALGMFENK